MQAEFKLTLIAFYGHYDILHSIIHLLHPQNINITIFTSDRGRDTMQTKTSRINIIYSQDRDAVYTLKKHELVLKKSDHIMVFTLFKNYTYYAKLASSLSLSFLVHNTHFAFSDNQYKLPWTNRVQNFKRVLLSTLSSHKNKRETLDRANTLLFLSEASLNYAKNHYASFSGKMKLLTYSYQVGQNKPNESRFTITIPGGINLEQRDYSPLQAWLYNLDIIRPIELLFLGKSNPSHINKFRSHPAIKNSKINITSFQHYLDQSEYDHLLQSSDIIIAPLKPRIIFVNYYEFYGKTKITGAVTDAIRFNIPIVLPSHYPAEEGMPIHHYNDESSFSQIMIKYYRGSISQSNIEGKHQFSEVQKRLAETLKSIVSK